MKFLFFLLFFIFNFKNVYAEKLKIFYAGFSFSNNYESNVEFAKFTPEIIQKTKSNGVDIISSKLLSVIQNQNFKNIDVDTNNLLDLNQYPDNAIVFSVVMQHEEFSEEYNYSTKKYDGFYDAYFQILFYDFSDKSLIAAIPLDFEVSMLSDNKLTNSQVKDRILKFYQNDQPFSNLKNLIDNFEIKRKYDRRIGVTNININDQIFYDFDNFSKKNSLTLKNLISQTFSKRLSLHHNVALVPYEEGQAIGKSMKMRFVQTDKVYSILLPNPDYHVHIDLKGFKKVLAKTADVNDLYLYGSFVDIKIFQPDLDNFIYFEESLRGVTEHKIPKSQIKINDWRKYYYNLEILFDSFSSSIIKPDNKWLKREKKKNIKKDLKNLNNLLIKVK